MFYDKLANFITGLGGGSDKSMGNSFMFRNLMPGQLEAMYRSDWLARKIVDIVPDDMTREWRLWRGEKDAIGKIEKYEKRKTIQTRIRVNTALKMARLYGGAAIYIGIPGHDPASELDPTKIRQDELGYLHVIPKGGISTGQRDFDPLSPNYGNPAYYTFGQSTQQVRVHPSRVVRFVGMPYPQDYLTTTDAWGDSLLQVVYDAIENATSSQQHVAALVPEAKLDIVYMPNLSKLLATPGDTAKLTARWSMANEMKSMHRLLLLEGNGGSGSAAMGENWVQKQVRFTDLPEVMQQFLQVAAGAADIPTTRLLGQSPAGLNATGDSDLRNYYDSIGAKQRAQLEPNLDVLDEVLVRSATGGYDEDMYYEWASLWQTSAKEKAEGLKLKADAAAAISAQGLIPKAVLSEGLVSAIIEDGSLPGLEAAVESAGGLAAAFEKEAAEHPELDPAEDLEPAIVADAAPRTLYVRRNVRNPQEILAWARKHFDTTLRASDLHVTIAFSRTPVDWMAISESWQPRIVVAAGGPRVMEKFGDAVVLRFNSNDLRWRHEEIKGAGASWDHPEYAPHVTISYKYEGNVDDIPPYTGRIVLGPEIFEEVKENWKEKVVEK